MPHRVGLRCDGSPTRGAGHVIRSLALGDELRSRGVEVVLLGDITDLPWVDEQVRSRGVPVVAAQPAAEALAVQARELGLDAVVLDGYDLDPEAGGRLRAAGVTVLALVDGPFGAAQSADVYLDQNLGATAVTGAPEGATMLLGLEHTLFRDTVLARRPTAGSPRAPAPGDRSPVRAGSDPLRVLAVFGGTDALSAAPVVVPLILATGLPLHVLAVAARPQLREELLALSTALSTAPSTARSTAPSTGDRQRLEVLDPVDDLAGLAVTCDAAVSAAGSSVWELLCIGVPTAVVCVADNQELGYRMVLAEGVAAPVGRLTALREDDAARREAVAELSGLLGSAARRARLRTAGMALLDGRGRERVADALLARIG